MSDESGARAPANAFPLTALPLTAWLLLTLGAAHAAAAAADLVSGGAGPAAAAVDGVVPLLVVGAAFAARRWGESRPMIGQDAAVVVVVALAAIASGVRGGADGRPWSAADVVLALLAAVVLPGARSFAVAVAAALAGWLAALLAGAALHRPEATASDWAGLGVLVGFGTIAAVGMRWGAVRLRAEIGRARSAASLHAVTDSLTGANNRRGLERLALPMIEFARRKGEAVHCLFLDVDGFRTVNDVLGRERGDDLLVSVHEAVLASIRATDVVARWAGDQFVVLGPGTGTSPLEMERRVRGHLTEEQPAPVEVWAPSVSIGSATLVPWDDGNLDSLLRRAEEDMQLRRSLRRQGRARPLRPPATSGSGSGSGEGGGAPSVERRGNPPTTPPATPPVAKD